MGPGFRLENKITLEGGGVFGMGREEFQGSGKLDLGTKVKLELLAFQISSRKTFLYFSKATS
jgi:hypothetical protein